MTAVMDRLHAFSQTRAAAVIKFLFGDPVQVYAVFLVLTSMYYYHEEYAWLWVLIALPVTALVMRFYDFVAKKGLLGSLLYLIYLAAGLYGVSLITNYTNIRYPISFAVWFLTPQGVTDFSMGYTIAIYLLMLGFLTSTVYYFSKVRYRMVMQLLIMMIPLALYAKENRQMPALLVVLLLASYFLLMIYCRMLRTSEEVRQISGMHTAASVGLFVTVFTVLAAIIPKPAFQADREFIENAMSYSTWSDILMNAISMFTETTDNRSATTTNARTLFHAAADEPLHLRTQTYSFYSGEDDSWTVTDYDRTTEELTLPLTYRPYDLMCAILDAAALDKDFARTYGLEDIGLSSIDLPVQTVNSLYLNPFMYFQFIPAPTRVSELTAHADQSRATVSDHNVIGYPFSAWTSVSVTYYPDTYVRYEKSQQLLDRLSFEDYDELLTDGQDVLFAHDRKEEALLMGEAYEECLKAKSFRYDISQLDYHSDTIDNLAAQITAGLDSDLEKALAIEQYFYQEEYVYDSSYEKPVGENVDDFLTTTHRGVCYEYATAMTMLCRSAGLPTRYVQGFLMQEEYENGARTLAPDYWQETNYVVKARDAHAFPEVYISGYGWVSFEPTVPSNEADAAGPENRKVMRWGFVLLGLALLVFLGWLALPSVRERLFRRKIQRMTPQACASAVFVRMRDTLRLRNSATVNELGAKSAPFFTKDTLFPQLDALLYRQNAEPITTVQALSEAYVLWDEERKAYQKSQKRAERQAAKAARARKRKEN